MPKFFLFSSLRNKEKKDERKKEGLSVVFLCFKESKQKNKKSEETK